MRARHASEKWVGSLIWISIEKTDLVQKRFRHDLAMEFVNLLQCRFKRDALFIDTFHDELFQYRPQRRYQQGFLDDAAFIQRGLSLLRLVREIGRKYP